MANGDGKEVWRSFYWLQERKGNKKGGGSKRNIICLFQKYQKWLDSVGESGHAPPPFSLLAIYLTFTLFSFFPARAGKRKKKGFTCVSQCCKKGSSQLVRRPIYTHYRLAESDTERGSVRKNYQRKTPDNRLNMRCGKGARMHNEI